MATANSQFSRVAEYYRALIAKHGHCTLACDYGHPASQRIKFDTLAAVCDHSDRSILDVGCGFGDYGMFLRQRYSRCRYSGIDITEDMIRQGRSAYPDLDLRLGNIFDPMLCRGSYDIVSANGIFYLLGEDAESLMFEAIAIMYSMATHAVAFNSLSTWANDRSPSEFHANPLRVAEYCRRFTQRVVMRHDYHPRDFTIYLYKEQHSG